MHFYLWVLVFTFLAPAVLADRSPKQGRWPKKSPSPIAGAKFRASEWSVNSITAQFYVPDITENLGTTSSSVFGVMIDGFDGFAGAFSGVQIIVDDGEVYYYAVSRSPGSTIFDVYYESDIRPGDYVTVFIEAYQDRMSAYASCISNRGSWNATIDLDIPLCSCYGSWVVEELPDLPLAEFGTVNLTVLANSGGSTLNAFDVKASTFSGDGATAFISETGGVEITVA